MSRIIVPGKVLVQEFAFQKETLPVHLPIVQYQRVSSDGQVTASLASLMLQDSKLQERIVKHGWQTKDIIPIDTDLGKSGQKRRDEREGLDRLYRLVETRSVGTVAAYDASRLYRDVTRVEYTGFVKMLEDFNVPLVTYKRVYFPSIRDDMKQLIRDFEDAAARIQWFQDVPGEAKLTAIQDSGSYGGGFVPVGFFIEGETGNKHFVVYEPHARLVLWLFIRYRELDGNLGRLFHEVRDGRFFFPAFQGVERVPHVSLDKDTQGRYLIKTRLALKSILTNVCYIGWYVYSGVVNKEAHPAIVPMDNFLYAYNRLSSVGLDGQVNEAHPPVNRTSYKTARKALVENILYGNDARMYAKAGEGRYVAVGYREGDSTTELSIPIARVDALVSTAVRTFLIGMEARHKAGMKDLLYARLQELQQTQAQSAVSYAQQLANTEKGIQQAEMDKRISLEQGYEHGVREAIILLKRLHTAKAELQEKANQAGSEEAKLAKMRTLISIALEKWEELSFEEKQNFVRLIVQRVNIHEIAPHILQLDILLHAPFQGTLTQHILRKKGKKHAWTPDELTTLQRLYMHHDRREILEALPTRSWKACLQIATEQGWKRTTRRNSSGIDESLTYHDAVLMRQLGDPVDTAPWVFEEAAEKWETSTENLIQVAQLNMVPTTIEEWTAPSPLDDNFVSLSPQLM